jgi:phenylpropionate dioxygenase-like ring-hydroxylating dioxygenase large terminal subunit
VAVTSFAAVPALRRAWHALTRSIDVGPASGPLAVTVCGEDLVVWRAGDGRVVAAPDCCPHRQAPLSAGTIVGGDLRCCYHGWTFDGGGRCVAIPALDADATIPPRAHLRTVATQERYGLVWICLDEPAAPLPNVPEDADGAFRRIVEPVARWHVAATRAVDNFLDVAHFPFVHAGTFGGAAEARVAPVTLEALGDFYGWRYEVRAANAGAATTASGQSSDVVERAMTTGFSLPFVVRSTIDYRASGLRHVLLLVTTPVDDEHSLFTFVVWRNDDRSVPDDEVVAFDRAIGAEDKLMLERIPGTLPLDATSLVSTQADRASLEWRRQLRAMLTGDVTAE